MVGGVGQGRDSTVLTIGELDFSACDAVLRDPAIRVVEHYRWTGVPHHEFYPRLADLLKSVWRCRRVVVDATGMGEGVASFRSKALGSSTVTAFRFTTQSKSRLGYNLLAAVSSGRLKMYARDGSAEYAQFWREVAAARVQYRANQTMSFYVDSSENHDDFLASTALLVEAGKYLPRVARGKVREESAVGV